VPIADLLVVDAAGRLVRRLESSAPSNGESGTAVWDGRDDAGNSVDNQDFSYDLRIVLTRSGSRLVLSEPLLTSLGPAALCLVTDTARPLLTGAKTLSYAANMLAARLARERGFDEALLVTPVGRILEVQTSAFFWVSDDGAVCTPPLSATGVEFSSVVPS